MQLLSFFGYLYNSTVGVLGASFYRNGIRLPRFWRVQENTWGYNIKLTMRNNGICCTSATSAKLTLKDPLPARTILRRTVLSVPDACYTKTVTKIYHTFKLYRAPCICTGAVPTETFLAYESSVFCIMQWVYVRCVQCSQHGRLQFSSRPVRHTPIFVSCKFRESVFWCG